MSLCFAAVGMQTSESYPPLFTVRNPEGSICLYTKGADTVILERLHKKGTMEATTEEVLAVSVLLGEAGCVCMRVLACACVCLRDTQRQPHTFGQSHLSHKTFSLVLLLTVHRS